MSAKPERDPKYTPLSEPEAKSLARSIVEDGTVVFSQHAEEEMKDDDLQTTDCLNLIRAGVYEPPELTNGELRYRVSTARMCVVLVFKSSTRLRVVTAWRKR